MKYFIWFIVLSFLVSCQSEVKIESYVSDAQRARGQLFYAETHPLGTGLKVDQLDLNLSDSQTLYAIKRNEQGEFVTNSSVSWSLSGAVGSLTIQSGGKSAIFNATNVGSGEIRIIVDNEIVQRISVDVLYNELNVSNLVVSSITSSSFIATVDVVGGTPSANHELFYCNATLTPGCDPLSGIRSVMGQVGATQSIAISGLSNPTDDYNIAVRSTDSVPVNGALLSSNLTLMGEAISISNLVITNPSLSGMNLTIDFTGDSEASASVSAYYCNETDSPGCDPLSGDSIVMTRGSSTYSASISGLSSPFDEADELNIRIVAVDSDGVSGSPLSDSDYLADLRVDNLSGKNFTATSFDYSVDIVETNTNASATLFYCNETDSPGCDPLAGNSVFMVRNGAKFEGSVTGLTSPNDLGDLLNIQVVASDPDGEIHLESMSETRRLTDIYFSEIDFNVINIDNFYASVDRLNDTNDTNSNLDIKLYWCNETDSPGCDPFINGGYDTVGGWYEYGFDVQGLTEDPGDTIKVGIRAIDPDGLYVETTDLGTTVDIVSSFVIPNPVTIYRSVGPGQTTALDTNATGNLTISGGTNASFSSDVSSQIGVGDALFYDTNGDGTLNFLAFISARVSNSSFTVQSVTGGSVANLSAPYAWKIYRSYTSVSDAVSGSENSGIALDSNIDGSLLNFDSWSGGKDISAQTGSDEHWFFALYAGVQADTSGFSTSGWTKDRAQKLSFVVVKDPAHVGISQRHSGVWDNSKYRLVVSDANAIRVETNRTRVSGLQVELAGTTDNNYVLNNRNNAEGIISHNIFKATSIGESLDGIIYYDYGQRGLKRTFFYNNLIYNFSTPSSVAVNVDWQSQGSESGWFYNNTIANNYRGVYCSAYRGCNLVNNIIVGSEDYDINSSGGLYRAYHNIISDTSLATQSTSISKVGNISAVSVGALFIDANSEDFRIPNASSAQVDAGFDLSSDFSDAIDGSSRDVNFDIGVFEY
ncbi:MAG: hypothetical protein CME66_04800 [Halobacteriovoraceae bacterium]|nr:hypothetical protein [Halobacteriovoraceae bacterium]